MSSRSPSPGQGGVVAVLVATAGSPVELPPGLADSGATHVPVDRPRKAFGTLAGIGPLDLLVDACADPAGEPERFTELFPLLADGGRYVALSGAATRRWQRPHRELRALLDGLPADDPLAAAVGERELRGGQLTVVRRGRTLAKLREVEMDQALRADPTRGRLVTSVPAVSFEARCTFRASTEERRDRTKPRYDAPVMRLREYHDVVCGSRSVVVQRNLLTPDTFRHHLAPRLSHVGLTDAGDRFVVPPFDDTAAPPLPGRWYHVDNENRGHFGHFMTEQLARVWAWPEAKAADPGLRALVTVNRGHRLSSWEQQLLHAAGIAPEDLEVVEGPVRVERLLAPTPMFSMPQYVHPAIAETWDRTGATLRSWGPPGPTPERVFCTRRHQLRACRNREVVEELFAEHGFAVVAPEELSTIEQAWMFHEAGVVAGFAGSALFNVLLSDRPKHLVMVGSDMYGASNEYMIAALRGHRIDLAVSRAKRRTGPKSRPYQAPFTFDPDREGAWLRPVLAAL